MSQKLTAVKRWVLWCKETRSGSQPPTKVPYTAAGIKAKVNDPADWSDYTTCCAALQENPQEFDGLGFVLGDGFVGVDLDNALGPKGLKPWAKQIFRALEKGRGLTYTEISPSGNGLHLIYTWDNPIKDGPTGRRFSPQPGTHFEAYLRNRYFTFTGKRFAPGKTPPEPQKAPEGLIALATLPPEIEIPPFEVVLAALRFGRKPLDVYLGQWRKYYPSASEAEQGFANYLSMLEIPKDTVSQLIMQSKIREPGDKKWEKRADYRERTLRKAKAGEKKSSEKTGNGKRRKVQDVENADLMAATIGNKIRWDVKASTWWIYKPTGIWVPTEADGLFEFHSELIEAQKATFEALGEDAAEIPLRSSSRYKAAVPFLRGKRELHIDPERFDSKRLLLCCRNGVLVFQPDGSYELKPHSPAFLCTRQARYAFREDASAELWVDTLCTIFEDQPTEALDFMQLLAGYLALDVIDERAFYVAYGAGRNGKSTFFETIRHILGSYAYSPMRKAVSATHEDPKEALAELFGRRFVLLDEFEKGGRIREDIIKALSAGGYISARRLWSHPFEFQARAKLVISTNHKPRLDAFDQALWDRLVLIPFLHRIPDDKVDPLRIERLKEPEHAEGVLAWIVRGASAYLRRRAEIPTGRAIPVPEAWQEEALAYRQEEDPTGEFFAETPFVVSETEFTPRPEAYRKYVSWCETNKVKPAGRNTFYEAMRQRFGKEVKVKGTWGWRVESQANRPNTWD